MSLIWHAAVNLSLSHGLLVNLLDLSQMGGMLALLIKRIRFGKQYCRNRLVGVEESCTVFPNLQGFLIIVN